MLVYIDESGDAGFKVAQGRSPGDLVTAPDRVCRRCGCTDADCSGCIARTGRQCHWIEEDLCSACEDAPAELQRVLGFLAAVIDMARTLAPPETVTGREALAVYASLLDDAARKELGPVWDRFQASLRAVAGEGPVN